MPSLQPLKMMNKGYDMNPLDASWDILHDDAIEKFWKKKLMRCARCKGVGSIITSMEQKWERTRAKPQGEMVSYGQPDTCPRCKGKGRVMMGWLDRHRAKMQQLREEKFAEQMAQLHGKSPLQHHSGWPLGESRTGEARPPGLNPKLCWNCRGSGMTVDEEGNRTTCPHCQPSQDE